MTCVSDTSTVNLDDSGGQLTAAVIVDPDGTNALIARPAGLYVALPNISGDFVSGDYKISAQAVDHGNWVKCDGSEKSRTTYANLFAVIGTKFGIGDGALTFNLPDPQGRGLVIKGTNADVNDFGKTEGLAVASRTPKHNSTKNLTLPTHTHAHSLALPSHGHSITDAGHKHTINQFAVASVADGALHWRFNTDAGTIDTSTVTTGITVDAPTSLPAITGAVGAPVTFPAIDGSIGPGGSIPNDMPAFIVPGNLFIHI